MKTIIELVEAIETESVLSIKEKYLEIPYWFLIRNSFLRAVIGKDIYEDSRSFYSRPKGRVTFTFEATIHFLRSIARFLKKNKSYALVFPSESGFYVRDYELVNRYADYFAEANQDYSHTILGATAGVKLGSFTSWPRWYSSITLPILIIKAYGLITQKFYLRQSRSFIDEMAELVCGFGLCAFTEEEKRLLAHQLASRISTVRLECMFYSVLFKHFKPKLILCEEGHYQHKVVLVRIAKKYSLETAEYQHGIIHNNHDAYNFSSFALNAKELKEFFPDYLLTYGQYWHRYIKTQSQLVPIGNPHRSTRIENLKLRDNLFATSRTILVIGDGIDTFKFLNLAKKFHDVLAPSFEVKFRPHPLEVQFLEKFLSNHEDRGKYNFSVDKSVDIYQSLIGVCVVVSEMSTVLYEAYGLVRHVVALESSKSVAYYSNIPFYRICDLDEFIEKLKVGRDILSSSDKHQFWSDDWADNYQEFFHSVIS